MLEIRAVLGDDAAMEMPGSNCGGGGLRAAGSVMTRAVLAVGLAIGLTMVLAALMSSAPQSWNVRADSGVGRFDGTWTGEMRTTFSSGPCGREYRIEMKVERGAATGSASRAGERFTLYGEIGDDGMLAWNASSGRGSVSGAGMVEGDRVSGDWEDSTGLCAGTFDIERTP